MLKENFFKIVPVDLPNSTTRIGTSGEVWVADWLQSQGAVVLARQWRCRSGELDLVVRTSDQIIAFVEVKTRSRGNWDSDGVWAITAKKQQRLIASAQLFLLKHPSLADCPCRFDVALVRRQGNAEFTLQDYICDAFC